MKTDMIQHDRIFHHVRGLSRSLDALLAQGMKAINLPVAQFYVLSVLWRRDGVSQKFLCEETYMVEGVMSQLVKEMVKSGIVDRKVDREDSRRRVISLTQEGRDIKARALHVWSGCLDGVTSGFTHEDIDDFTSKVDYLRSNALDTHDFLYGPRLAETSQQFDLVEILKMGAEKSVSVISPRLDIIYMNDKFRTFFKMPQELLKTGDSAETFYRALAKRREFKIHDTETYIFRRMNELRELKGTASEVRDIDGRLYFRITRRKLPDGHIITTTEMESDHAFAKAEMARLEETQRVIEIADAEFFDGIEKNVKDPLKAISAHIAELSRNPAHTHHAAARDIQRACETFSLRIEALTP